LIKLFLTELYVQSGIKDGYSKEIAPATISRWIVATIKLAYWELSVIIETLKYLSPRD
jgi:hypothetical protein